MRGIAVVVALLVAPLSAAASEVGCPARKVVPEARATYYEPTVEGSCSLPIAPGELFAAIADDDYDGSEACGRCARVTGPEGSVTVRIVDVCVSATCDAGHLDLSYESFDAIADPLDGDVPISWETVACDVGADTMKIEFEGSHIYYLKLQVQDHRHGIASVEMQQGAGWTELQRVFDDHFVHPGVGAPFTPPFVFRIADLHGQVVETGAVALVNGVPLDTGVQFEPCPEPGGAIAASAALLALRARRRS